MKLKNIKNTLLALSVNFILLLVYIVLLATGLGNQIYPAYIAHAFLMVFLCIIAASISYFAYSSYQITLDITVFFISTAFFIYFIGFLAHFLAAPMLYLVADELFHLSEYIGLFFGSAFLLFGLVFRSDKVKEIINNNADRILVGSAAFYASLFVVFTIFPDVASLIHEALSILLTLTAVFLLLDVAILIAQYRATSAKSALCFAVGFSLLLYAVIISLLGAEIWSMYWWFVHAVVLTSFGFMSFGIITVDSRLEEIRREFADIPFYSRILTRLLFLFVVVLGVGPLLTATYFSFGSFRGDFEKQILEQVSAIAKSKEGHLLSFLVTAQNRANDFSSDGKIRDLTEAITRDPGNAVLARVLNYHLKMNKMPIDKSVYGINITDLQGIVVASTDTREIGKNESKENYFIGAASLQYGEAFIGDIAYSHHFGPENKIVITGSAPLFNHERTKKIGVLINYYTTDELDNLLMGRLQTKFGVLSAPRNGADIIDAYLANKDGFIISESKYLGKDAFLKQKVETEPVIKCADRKETKGRWINYVGDAVYGASTCVVDLGWTLAVEVKESYILQPLFEFRRSLTQMVFITLLFIGILGFYFSRRFSRPIESLVSVSQSIASGDFGARVPSHYAGEIGELSKAFNYMLDKLQGANKTIDAERTKLNIVLDSLPLAVDIVDENRIILYANQVFKNIFGAKCVGGKCYMAVKADKQVCVNCPLKKSGVKYPDVIEVEGANGNSYSVIHTSFKDVNGQTRWIEVFVDVSKERSISRAKSEFVSVASHQLRTPLTAINWYIEMLLDESVGRFTKKQKEYMYEVYNGSKRMVRLIDDLLNLSRIESGKFHIEPISLNVLDLIQMVVNDLRPMAQSKKCKIALETPKDPLPPIPLDPALLRQVLNNIIINAIAYSAEARCAIFVQVSMKKGGELIGRQRMPDEKYLLISVKDEGIGIPKTEQYRVFDKFFRASNAVRKVTTGTGLGLYISKLAVESFGGKIALESVEGKGTTVYVAVPAKGMKRQ